MKQLILVVLLCCSWSWGQEKLERGIGMGELKERIRGAWAGKIVGVVYGAPTEFKFRAQIIPMDKLVKWTPDLVRAALKQDDLYIQMVFAQAMKEKGLGVTTADFGAAFKETKFGLWHASQAARRALRRGATWEESGTPKWTTHGNDISFQINADFVGLSCPGMPRSASDLIDRAGRIMAWGDGLYSGSFIAGMYSEAYFSTDPRQTVETGLKCLPGESKYAEVIRDVLKWSAENPENWEKTWHLVEAKWDQDDMCPYGAMAPLNIDAKLNGAYVAIGLLYGKDDFAKVIEIATRCGQDSDCNPSTAAGIWAAARGFAKIPARYTEQIESIADEKFQYTNASYHSIVEDTVNRALAIAEKSGGRREGEKLIILAQMPQAAKLREFKVEKPIERISCADPRWVWTGAWTDFSSAKTGLEKLGSEKGCEAKIRFNGTGAIIVGPYVGAGGKADVYLDGKLDQTVDVWPDDSRRVVMECVWHKYGLPPGEHEVRLVVKGERMGESTGTEVRVHSLVVME